MTDNISKPTLDFVNKKLFCTFVALKSFKLKLSKSFSVVNTKRVRNRFPVQQRMVIDQKQKRIGVVYMLRWKIVAIIIFIDFEFSEQIAEFSETRV